MFLRILFALALLALPSPVWAAAFGVSPGRVGGLAPGFYVATAGGGGSDSNAGTLAAPFLTLTKARDAMRASSIKRTYIRGGTYTPASAGTGCSKSLSAALLLDSNDNGTTWQYYPPDGYNSAIFNGQAVGSSGLGYGICTSADNLTVNGLFFQNYRVYGIETTGLNPLIENNKVDNITDTGQLGTAGIVTQNAANGQLIHNIVTNTVCHGIASFPTSAHGADNLLIAYNYVYTVSTASPDCGGIYLENNQNQTQSGQLVAYNYVGDTYIGGGANPYYIDDLTSNYTLTGNIARPGGGTAYPCYFVHGGSNNTNSGNICDIVDAVNGQILTIQAEENISPRSTTNGTTLAGNPTLHFAVTPSPITTEYVWDFTASAITAGTTITGVTGTTATMSANAVAPGVGSGDTLGFAPKPTGNTFTSNLILSKRSGANVGGGYVCNNAGQFPCGTLTNGPNGYHNFVGSSTNAGATSGMPADSAPQQQILGTPAFTDAWTYTLPPTSPVYNAPVNFPVQPSGWGTAGFWGPPGFVVPHVGTGPSGA